MLLQELQLTEDLPIHLEPDETVGVDQEVPALVTRLDDLPGGEGGDGGFGFVHIDIIQPRGGPRSI